MASALVIYFSGGALVCRSSDGVMCSREPEELWEYPKGSRVQFIWRFRG